MKVIIADHHPIAQKGIAELLTTIETPIINKDVLCISTFKQLMKSLRKKTPNILFLELELPGLSGIHSIKEIKKEFKGIKIFVLSYQSEEIYALSAIKSGASAFVCKTTSIETLKGAIERVLHGGIYLNEELSNQLNERTLKKSTFNTFNRLSTREVEVLNLLSGGIRNKDIAYKLDINEKTVSTYKMRLLKKLNANNLADLINQSRILQY